MNMNGGQAMNGPRDGHHGRNWRIAAWTAAALLLLVPLVAMQFTNEVTWSVGDFVFAAVLLFGTLGLYELAVRKTGSTIYRAGVGLALVAVFLLVWINGAVGITDSAADGWFFLVPVVGLVGAFIARFRSPGMTVAMFVTAGTVALVAMIALIAGVVPAFNSAFEVLGIAAFFVVLFVGSALLFREAARSETNGGAA